MFARQDGSEILGASRRIATGQTGAVGPVQASAKLGVRLNVATLSQPQSPVSIVLAPGKQRVSVQADQTDPATISVVQDDRK